MTPGDILTTEHLGKSGTGYLRIIIKTKTTCTTCGHNFQGARYQKNAKLWPFWPYLTQCTSMIKFIVVQLGFQEQAT